VSLFTDVLPPFNTVTPYPPLQPLPPIKFSASLPKEMVSIVIGRGGAKIQRIMDQSDANVAVEPLTPLFGRMRFKGSPGSIVKAQVS
jgi:hypothetical protein